MEKEVRPKMRSLDFDLGARMPMAAKTASSILYD
jgi:hypothetical protein